MTSVPPTQPPAAPETDVRLTDAEKSYGRLDAALQWRGRWYSEASVERIVAERVRVVEGERDAAGATHRNLVSRLGFGDNITEPMADNDTIVNWFEQQGRDASEWQESQLWRNDCYAAGHPQDDDCHKCDPRLALIARAESAEAAHAALVAAVEALADEYARRQARNAAHNGNVSCSVWGIAGTEVGRLAGGAR